MDTDNRLASQKEISQPATLPDKHYWPFQQLPALKNDVYAQACVEAALKLSTTARTAYYIVAQQWQLPGCRALIDELRQHEQDFWSWNQDRAKAIIKNQPQPDYPNNFKDTALKFRDDTDFRILLKKIVGFIYISFNRKEDIDNGTPKVFRNSFDLVCAVLLLSLSDYLEERSEIGEFSDSELTDFRFYCHIFTGNATTRFSRKTRRALKQHRFNLHNYQTILDGAEMWYRARVLCKTAREAAHYYRIAPTDLSKRIEVYDDAVGYPRRR